MIYTYNGFKSGLPQRSPVIWTGLALLWTLAWALSASEAWFSEACDSRETGLEAASLWSPEGLPLPCLLLPPRLEGGLDLWSTPDLVFTVMSFNSLSYVLKEKKLKNWRWSSSLACSKAFSWLSMCLAGTVAGILAVVLMTAGLRSTGGTDWGLLAVDTEGTNVINCSWRV